MFTLAAEKRDSKTKAKILRKQGFLPAVYYGHKQESTPVALKMGEFLKVWKDAGESSVVELVTPEGNLETLIYDVQLDPVTNQPVHADFYVPEAGKKVTVSVPIEFVGVSPAVKDLGGLLVKVLHELEIEVLPKDLPHAISVDISTLKTLDAQIMIKDLKLASSVTILANPEEVVAAISVAQEEPEEAPAQDISSIEVVGEKGKKEEEGEAPAEGKKEEKGK